MVSIIIVNYNAGLLVKNCVKSIEQETRSELYEIIIVDNNSTEDIRPFLKNYGKIKYIFNKFNAGFGIANNMGIDVANGEYILLLNSDTLIMDNAIDKSVNYLKSRTKTGLLGCRLLNEDLSIQKSVFHKSSFANYLVNSNPLLSKLSTKKHDFDYSKTQFVTGVTGAFMLFRREVFEKIKPFDPDFFMFSEEMDLCRNRVSKCFNIEFFAGAKVIHLGGKSGSKDVMYHQSMLSFALTWYKNGIPSYIFYVFTLLLNLLSALIGYILTGSNGKKDLLLLVKGYIKIFPYVFIEIPKYKRGWGSRKKSLMLKELNE